MPVPTGQALTGAMSEILKFPTTADLNPAFVVD